jgi:hypothetical protein
MVEEGDYELIGPCVVFLKMENREKFEKMLLDHAKSICIFNATVTKPVDIGNGVMKMEWVCR